MFIVFSLSESLSWKPWILASLIIPLKKKKKLTHLHINTILHNKSWLQSTTLTTLLSMLERNVSLPIMQTTFIAYRREHLNWIGKSVSRTITIIHANTKLVYYITTSHSYNQHTHINKKKSEIVCTCSHVLRRYSCHKSNLLLLITIPICDMLYLQNDSVIVSIYYRYITTRTYQVYLLSVVQNIYRCVMCPRSRTHARARPHTHKKHIHYNLVLFTLIYTHYQNF